MCFKILYKLYKLLFLVDTNQMKSWTNIEFDLSLAATNSKKSMHILHKKCFFQNFIARRVYYTQMIMEILFLIYFSVWWEISKFWPHPFKQHPKSGFSRWNSNSATSGSYQPSYHWNGHFGSVKSIRRSS